MTTSLPSSALPPQPEAPAQPHPQAGEGVDSIASASSPSIHGSLKKHDSHLWIRHPHDWYVEPKWVSERLFDTEDFIDSVHDPACGSGRIIESAALYGFHATGSDIVQRLPGAVICDWLAPSEAIYDNIVTNPPFGLCDDKKAGNYPFVDRCLERARYKVALLLPSKWIHGDARSRWLEKQPLARVYFITPRPSMPPGPVIGTGQRLGGGTIDFAWFVFEHGYSQCPQVCWLRRDDGGPG